MKMCGIVRIFLSAECKNSNNISGLRLQLKLERSVDTTFFICGKSNIKS